MTTRVRYTIAGGIVILIALVVLKLVDGKTPADTRRQNIPLVKVEHPRRESVLYKLSFTGDVVPIQQASIYSKVAGNIEREYVDIGAAVAQNQLLALIDTTELSQQFRQSEATYENAKLNFERTKELAEQNLVAKQDLDNAEAAAKVAKANFDNARTRLDYALITAPFSGTITKRLLDPGALVTANNTILFSLMDLNAMKITVQVLEKDIPRIAKGKKAVITVDAFPGKQFIGSVTRYSDAVDLDTRTMAVEIDIPNRDHLLKPGMYASVTLVVDEHLQALTLPTIALLKDDRGYFILAAEGTKARRKDVRPGVEQNSRTEILSGLTGDESVITTGQQFARDGGEILIQQ